jgi:hypothetical protein
VEEGSNSLAEDYQAEFAALTQGETSDTPQATTEAAVDTNEYIEIPVNGQMVKIPMNAEVPFKHAGTINKAPFSKILNEYRQGMHLDSKRSEYQKIKEEAEKARGESDSYQQMRQKYEAIQKWSEENPDQWERLYQMWQERDKVFTSQGPTDPNNQLLQHIKGLEGKLKTYDEFMHNYQSKEQEQKTQQNVALVEQDMATFAKDFPEISLEEKDEEGYPLKSRIVAFGVQNDIPDFESAALKYLKPRLLEVIQGRVRNETVKTVKSDKQQGIVGRSSTPQGKGSEVDPKKLSWNQLGEMARAEFDRA